MNPAPFVCDYDALERWVQVTMSRHDAASTPMRYLGRKGDDPDYRDEPLPIRGRNKTRTSVRFLTH